MVEKAVDLYSCTYANYRTRLLRKKQTARNFDRKCGPQRSICKAECCLNSDVFSYNVYQTLCYYLARFNSFYSIGSHFLIAVNYCCTLIDVEPTMWTSVQLTSTILRYRDFCVCALSQLFILQITLWSWNHPYAIMLHMFVCLFVQ